MADETNITTGQQGSETANETQGNEQQGSETANETQGNEQQGKTYTDAEVNEIIDKKFAKWQKQQDDLLAAKEKQAAEDEKKAAMDATQKAEYERDQLKNELDELKHKARIVTMTGKARAALKADGVDVPDELITPYIQDDEATTMETIKIFSTRWRESLDNGFKAALSGSTPAKGSAAKLTKAEIMAVKDRAERQRLISENMDLFK